MSVPFGLSFAATALAWIFGAIGLLHLVAPRPLVAAYRSWGYAWGYPIAFGLISIATAALLADPEQRLWGVALAGLVLFIANVTLLSRRHYLGAAAGMLLMMALPLAAATAVDGNRMNYAAEPVSVSNTE